MVFTQNWASLPDTAEKGFDPDQAVTAGPPRRSPYELGLQASINPSLAARSATHTAPGEAALEVVVPSVTKATPRHPSTGRYMGRIAAGHADLRSQPKPLSGGGGPQNAAMSEPGTRPGRSMLDVVPQPSSIATTVPVSRLDLAGPAGLPSGLVRSPDPSPISRPSPALDPPDRWPRPSRGGRHQSQRADRTGHRPSFIVLPAGFRPVAACLLGHRARGELMSTTGTYTGAAGNQIVSQPPGGNSIGAFVNNGPSPVQIGTTQSSVVIPVGGSAVIWCPQNAPVTCTPVGANSQLPPNVTYFIGFLQ